MYKGGGLRIGIGGTGCRVHDLTLPGFVEFRLRRVVFVTTHRPLSSSFEGLPHRIRNVNHKKELLRDLHHVVSPRLIGVWLGNENVWI